MVRIGLAALVVGASLASASALLAQSEGVVVASEGWELIGDLIVPESPGPHPAVLMLNQAAGTRVAYADLAAALGDRGMVSLRLDLRGHGESTNLGRFVPGELPRDPLIWDAEVDVAAALDFLRSHPSVDADRVAVVGASYSGEEAAESGRLHGFQAAYVLLSPGSLSRRSIDAVDGSGADWLVISSEDDPYLTEIVAAVAAQSTVAHIETLSGGGHATDLFDGRPGLAARIAQWLGARLGAER